MDSQRIQIVVQGPAFPKLIGRLCYSNILEHKTGPSIFFITFRRRFLAPTPVLRPDEPINNNKCLEDYLYGPFPDPHESALIRRFFLWNPAAQNLETLPLMIEVLANEEGGKNSRSEVESFVRELNQTGGKYSSFLDSSQWILHPDVTTLKKVYVPKELLNLNKSSWNKLTDLLSSDTEINKEVFRGPIHIDRKIALRLERLSSSTYLEELYISHHEQKGVLLVARNIPLGEQLKWYLNLSGDEYYALFSQ
jgi:hypothetical protein